MNQRFALLLLLPALMTSCERRPAQAPSRPAKVPTSAVWAGGSDGGAFIDCRETSERLNDCTVYFDGNGEIWMHGLFKLKGKNKGVPNSALKYSFADGVGIGLLDGSYLEPTTKERSER